MVKLIFLFVMKDSEVGLRDMGWETIRARFIRGLKMSLALEWEKVRDRQGNSETVMSNFQAQVIYIFLSSCPSLLPLCQHPWDSRKPAIDNSIMLVVTWRIKERGCVHVLGQANQRAVRDGPHSVWELGGNRTMKGELNRRILGVGRHRHIWEGGQLL